MRGEVFRARRRELASAVKIGLIAIPGNVPMPRNFAANTFPMHQDGTFRYYFGLEDPSLFGLIDAESGEATIFGSEPTDEQRIWEGPLPTLAELAAQAGVAATGSLAQAKEACMAAAESGRPIHFTIPYQAPVLLLLAEMLGVPATELPRRASHKLTAAIVAQREVKSAEEIAEMEDALVTTARMHRAAMATARPGRYEYEVLAAVAHAAAAEGLQLAYPPIVTKRGDVLHNIGTTGRLAEGDLLLHDGGAMSRGGYASDVTRTFPVSGRFTAIQRDLYSIVLAAQQAAIDVLRPQVKFADAHLRAATVLSEGLIGLGLLSGTAAEAVETGAYSVFMPHGLGHQIGLDVHDMEALGEDAVGYDASVQRTSERGLRPLRLGKEVRAGMTTTVEPGFYVVEALLDRLEAEGRYAGQVRYDEARKLMGFGGIRIEDDIVITDEGARVLGPKIPKSIDEVEHAIADCLGA